jgi:large subunit ribosomal protein L31
MKKDIHPQYHQATVHCAGCSATFTVGSTVPEIRIGVCSECHPFYTGKQKFVDAEGRVDRFRKKYGGSKLV